MGKPDGQQNRTISWDNSIGLNIDQLYGDNYMGQQYRAMTGCYSNGLQQGTVTQNKTWDNNI